MAEHSAEEVETKIAGAAREIASKRSLIVGILAAILTVLVMFHVITPELSTDANNWIAGGFVVLSTVGAGRWIRKDVTPSDPTLNPTSSSGEPLVPDPELKATILSDQDPAMEGDEELAALMTNS